MEFLYDRVFPPRPSVGQNCNKEEVNSLPKCHQVVFICWDIQDKKIITLYSS
uniref:Uncharacterized protein n=1 Tax=Tetranychus urticae TaxID=32264 RepID=T1KJV1_TETUR